MTSSDHVNIHKFYMFRCIIAMAHADGVVTDEERAYISAFINRLPFNDEQIKTLNDDLDTVHDFVEFLKFINDPQYRSQVVYFARIMAYKDGNISPSEQDILDRLHAHILEGVDFDEIKKTVHQAVRAEMVLHDIEIDKIRPKKGKHAIPWFQWLDEILLSQGIDLLRD